MDDNCVVCNGSGEKSCIECAGLGTCPTCGTGNCPTCGGRGIQDCDACDGSGEDWS